MYENITFQILFKGPGYLFLIRTVFFVTIPDDYTIPLPTKDVYYDCSWARGVIIVFTVHINPNRSFGNNNLW